MYRDHLGRRVIAACEGFGCFTVERADAPIDPSLTQGTFEYGLLIVALGDGLVSVAVQAGRTSLPRGETVHVDLPYRGSGWALDLPSGAAVDERHEPSPSPSPNLIVPFFRLVDGAGRAAVVLSSSVCDRIDHFNVWDEDALKARGFKVQNMSRLVDLDSCFTDGTTRSAPVASHLNAAAWSQQVPPGCRGMILRKTYDRFHGRQLARVVIDGLPAGWWYAPLQDRSRRWAVTDYGVPRELVEGKSSIRIVIDPPAGTPLWSFSTIEVFSLS